jgi:hypothetical protein
LITVAGLDVAPCVGDAEFVGLLAIAEVDRRTRGRLSSFPDPCDGTVVAADSRDLSVDCGVLSTFLRIPFPLLCNGNLGTGVVDPEPLVTDCDRCREDSLSLEDDCLRRSVLLVDKCPGVWLLEGASRAGSESSGISCGLESVGDSWMIFCDRSNFDLLGDLALSRDFC